jgi:uncharacterized protein YcnI
MRLTHRAPLRALITSTAAAAALLFGAAPAWAHIHVDADDAAPGSYATLTFHVPNESEKGALTTQLRVELPNVASAGTEVMPGWTARLDRDTAAGTVRSVTWTAAPSTGIPPDQFALFRISVKLPDQQSVNFPVTQTYSDGQVVKWDQPPLANGDEPEYPVPALNLAGGEAHEQPQAAPEAAAQEPASESADGPARWLAGGALVLAAVSLAVVMIGRRRT